MELTVRHVNIPIGVVGWARMSPLIGAHVDTIHRAHVGMESSIVRKCIPGHLRGVHMKCPREKRACCLCVFSDRYTAISYTSYTQQPPHQANEIIQRINYSGGRGLKTTGISLREKILFFREGKLAWHGHAKNYFLLIPVSDKFRL